LFRKIGSFEGLELVVTKHALKRMKERGCNPVYVYRYLRRIRKLHLKRNSRGHEAAIPFKGRLAGDFDGEKFIIKTFLPPYYIRRDYNLCVRKTKYGFDVTITKIRIGTTFTRRSFN